MIPPHKVGMAVPGRPVQPQADLRAKGVFGLSDVESGPGRAGTPVPTSGECNFQTARAEAKNS
jgi:hypothetical protein